MLRLALEGASLCAPNPYSKFKSERSPVRIRNCPNPSRGLLRFRPSYRTLVTKFSNSRNYRFFSTRSAKYANASAVPHNHFMASPPLPSFLLGIYCPGLVSIASCGHTRIPEDCSGSRVLLPLRRIARPRRLRKVVRFEAICVPLAGGKVRETAHAYSDQ